MLIDEDTKRPIGVEVNSLATSLGTISLTSNTAADEPPPYTEPAAANTSIPPLPRHNHLWIQRDDGNIKGTYVIDPSLPVPQGTGTLKELGVHTKDGQVDLKVYFVGGRDLNRRARIIVGSDDGDVKLAIVERPSYMRMWIAASTGDGHVSVSLPKGFSGLLSVVHRDGNVTVRPSLTAVTRTFEETPTEYKGWIGHWNGENLDDWEGDVCRLSTKDGNVKVGFYEGEIESGGGITGLVRQLFH